MFCFHVFNCSNETTLSPRSYSKIQYVIGDEVLIEKLTSWSYDSNYCGKLDYSLFIND